MDKYINADRLKAKLDEYYRKYQSKYMETRFPYVEGLIDAIDLAEQIINTLQQEQGLIVINKKDWEAQEQFRKNKDFGKPLQQEQPEVDLEKFTEKMEDWKARYNHPDNIPIKATMAFTARMFYMYPDVARQWYDNLPKATQD